MCQCPDQGMNLVGIVLLIASVMRQVPDPCERVVTPRHRLDPQPFIHYQWEFAPAFFKKRQRLVAARKGLVSQRCQRSQRISHIVSGFQLFERERVDIF